MDGHFRAFSFVDRISRLEPRQRIHGHYTVPATLATFAPSLVAEAAGQLAAWAAMDAVGFESRPLAGIAGRIELLREVSPGDVIDLSVEIQSVDADATGYSGLAEVAGVPVLRLHDCVGPMLPVESFDDPGALRRRFAEIRGAGAAPGAFGGIPDLEPTPVTVEPGGRVEAVLEVPQDAPFFSDHFPRRPVLPGTLLMHAASKAASTLVRSLPNDGSHWRLQAFSDVKLRSFIPPGSTVRFEATLPVDLSNGHGLPVAVSAHIGKKRVGDCTMNFSRGSQP